MGIDITLLIKDVFILADQQPDKPLYIAKILLVHTDIRRDLAEQCWYLLFGRGQRLQHKHNHSEAIWLGLSTCSSTTRFKGILEAAGFYLETHHQHCTA